jgi:hypothetical protein
VPGADANERFACDTHPGYVYAPEIRIRMLAAGKHAHPGCAWPVLEPLRLTWAP